MDKTPLARDDRAPPGRRDPIASVLSHLEPAVAGAQLDHWAIASSDHTSQSRWAEPALDADLEICGDASVSRIRIDLAVEIGGQRDANRTGPGVKGQRSLIGRELDHPDIDDAISG